jgi:hypothetical protein
VWCSRWWNVSPGSCFSWFNHTQEKSEWDCAIPSVPSAQPIISSILEKCSSATQTTSDTWFWHWTIP